MKDSTKRGRACARTRRQRGSDLPGGGRFIGVADEVLPVASPVRVVGLPRAPPWACAVTDTSLRGTWRAPRSRSSSPPCLISTPRRRGHRPRASPARLSASLRRSSSGPLAPPPFALHGRGRSPTDPAEAGVASSRARESRSDSAASTPGTTGWCCPRRVGATRPARSVLVVSHHLDGLPPRRLRGLVASRSRSWGSPGFEEARDVEAREPLGRSLQFPWRGWTPRRRPRIDSRTLSPGPLPPWRSTPPRDSRRATHPLPGVRADESAGPRTTRSGFLRTSPCTPAPTDTPNHEGTEVSGGHHRVVEAGDGNPGGCRLRPQGPHGDRDHHPDPPLPEGAARSSATPHGHLGKGDHPLE